jgi:hypothetical protein
MHSTYVSEVNTVSSKGGAQKIQFFRHGGGDRAKAGKSVSDPKLSQILIADQCGFDQFPEMECGLEDLGLIPFLSHIGRMKPIQAAPAEDVPGEGGHDDGEVFFRQSEEGLQALNKLANTSIRVKRDVTQEVEFPPPHPKWEDQRTVHMLEFKGSVPKHVKDDRAIFEIFESGEL